MTKTISLEECREMCRTSIDGFKTKVLKTTVSEIDRAIAPNVYKPIRGTAYTVSRRSKFVDMIVEGDLVNIPMFPRTYENALACLTSISDFNVKGCFEFVMLLQGNSVGMALVECYNSWDLE